MVYANHPYQPSMAELARAGNFQAIAYWINRSLSPYGMRAHVGGERLGCLKVLLELQASPTHQEAAEQWREDLVRFICHCIWTLNSARIEGVRIAAWIANEPEIRWEQSVRVISPARRKKQQQAKTLSYQIQQTTSRKAQLKAARSILMTGPLLFAFVFGGVLGFLKAPVDQTNAAAAPSQPNGGSSTAVDRPDTVQAALETVPVMKHTKATALNDPTVTLMFAGDVTLAESFTDAIGKDYGRVLAAMDEYRHADLAMVNLENPLTHANTALPGKQFNFKADPDSVKVLTDGGVDLVTLANNHTMDYQESGLRETIETLDRAGVQHIGAGQNVKEARRPDIIDVKGQRVAYLGYYGADFEVAGEQTAGTNYAEETRIAADIQAIRSQVDWIVVNFHWGEELATHPADWQQQLARFTIDQGADVVVGHHPHVLQGAEIYKGRPIAYSLGNFIFGGNSRRDYDTAVLKVALKDKQMKVEFLPVEVRNYQPKVVSGDRGAEILRQIDDRSSGFQAPMRSPAILDARRSPEGLSTSPATDATTPLSPSASPVPPAAPTDNVAPSTAPNPAAIADPATPSPSATPATPAKPSNFAPKDSFINAPGRTPFTSITPETKLPGESNPPTPDAPQPEPAEPTNTSALPPTQAQQQLASEQPIADVAPATSDRQSDHQAAWTTAGQVGSALVPDVSLMAAMAW